MQLPGGYLQGEVLVREIEFVPIDGHLELALAEIDLARTPMPHAVSQVLARALALPGGHDAAAALEVARALSVADRQYLVRALATRLGMDHLWLTGLCQRCDERFDVEIAQSALPVKPAGAGYPWATVDLAGTPVRVRVPNGQDQEALAHVHEPAEAQALLRARLTCGAAMEAWAWPLVEATIEALAPEAAEEVQTSCPHCGHANQLYVDPYACLHIAGDALFDEIHQIASHYHWRERDILDLPRDRRQRYLALINGARAHLPAHWATTE